MLKKRKNNKKVTCTAKSNGKLNEKRLKKKKIIEK